MCNTIILSIFGNPLQIFGLVFTFLFTPLLTYQLLLTIHKPDDRTKCFYFFASAALGPAIVAGIFNILLKFFAGYSNFFYLITIFSLFFVIFIIHVGVNPKSWITSFLKNVAIMSWARESGAVGQLALYIIFIAGMYLTYISISFLNLQSDYLEYLLDAQKIILSKDITIYPINEPSSIIGFYAPSVHPPALPILMAWLYLLQGQLESSFLHRFIGPFYSIVTILMVWSLGNRYGWFRSSLCSAILLFTPLYFSQSVGSPMDSLRLSFFFLVLLF